MVFHYDDSEHWSKHFHQLKICGSDFNSSSIGEEEKGYLDMFSFDNIVGVSNFAST